MADPKQACKKAARAYMKNNGVNYTTALRAVTRNGLVQTAQWLPTSGPEHAEWVAEFAAGRIHIAPGGIHLDLNRDPHTLVTGSFASGKTVLTELVRYGATHTNGQVVNLAWSGLGPPAQLDRIHQEMLRRQELLAKHQAPDMSELRAIAAADGFEAPPRLLVVVDDLDDFIASRGARLLAPIAAGGRAVEVNLIIAARPPTVELLPPTLLVNLANRIGFGELEPQTARLMFGGITSLAPDRPGAARFVDGPGNDHLAQAYIPPRPFL